MVTVTALYGAGPARTGNGGRENLGGKRAVVAERARGLGGCDGAQIRLQLAIAQLDLSSQVLRECAEPRGDETSLTRELGAQRRTPLEV